MHGGEGERRGRETLFSGLAAAAAGLIRVGRGGERGKRKNIQVGGRGEHDQVTKATRRRKKRNVFLFFVLEEKTAAAA